MNWKLISYMSLPGLAMAFATVFFIPGKHEPYYWFVIYTICAYIFTRKLDNKYFMHGFLTGFSNCIWIILVHILLFRTYNQNHPNMAAMSHGMPLQNHPRLLMALNFPVFGAVFGSILGLYAWIMTKIIKKK